ncbi:MAG: HD domain-containing protein [Treponemataceae bacterium]
MLECNAVMKTSLNLDEQFFSHPIRDPLWKHIYLHPTLVEICNTPSFLRLSHIKQLGPTNLVYPGATHTRSLHSLGVFHLAKKLLKHLLQKGASQWTSQTGICSFLAASLLHDVGHFPFTHSLKELPLKDHEQLSAQLILPDSIKTLLEQFGANAEQTAHIIDHSMPTTDEETLFYRKLLSGVLDPDKLDYLNRDAFFCGVPYGIQDTDYIFSQLIPHKEKGAVLNAQAILAVESLLFSKYMMYRSVYWHKYVRVATAMMKKTLFAALNQHIISPEQLYTCTDTDVLNLLKNKNFDEKFCVESLCNQKLYRILSEEPFNEKNAEHKNLQDLAYRTHAEKELAKKLGKKPHEVLIDIPEKISFESDLWISDEMTTFSSSSTVFKNETIASFTSVLRKVRVAVCQ